MDVRRLATHFLSLEDEVFGQGSAQIRVIDHVLKCVQDVGRPPGDHNCPGAFDMLRAPGGYTDEPAVGSLCSFDPGKVSLPESGWSPIPLSDLWGQNGCDFVGELC